MSTKNIVDLYNPKHSAKLKEADIAGLRDLTNDQIAELAEAHQNSPTSNNYLVLEDTRKGAAQLYPLSTWQNLHDLRNSLGQNHYVVKGFKDGMSNQATVQQVGEVQDLTGDEVNKGLNEIINHAQDSVNQPNGGNASQTPVEEDIKLEQKKVVKSKKK